MKVTVIALTESPASHTRGVTIVETVNPYAPTKGVESSEATDSVSKRIIRYSTSTIVLAAGLGLLIAGVSTYSSLAISDHHSATHGTAKLEWTLISALLTVSGLLWMLASIVYWKRRTRVGHWMVITGFFAALLSMCVGIPV
ncbi:hypothetical protein CA85_35710 [Allorhodopirellula solitaria]|uniref:Uncharacterized protein n=1 Tax=Allorhodopirellula solitaria TaxID=2527987 RepID=A0A5C5XNL6_9BACT|nr:hypothetical protein CA85_35710 [Allorhodopirellula solitaria]